MRHHGFGVALRLAYRTFFASSGTFARLTPKRFVMMMFMIPVVVLTQVIHHIAFLIDDLLFSDYRQIVPRRPLFMVGIPRSGTTFLHRLLSDDTESFTTLTTWEMVLAPSIVERKFFILLGKIDSALGGYGRRLVIKIEDRIFAPVRKIHHISLFAPEEDDIALYPIFASMFMLFPFPFPEEMAVHARFDVDMPADQRREIMSFYRACVQRHLYVHGQERRFLSKNPIFTAKIDTLVEFFPDCDILCNVRSPYQAIPSLLSFVSFTWRRFDNDMRGSEFYDMMLDIVAFWYRHPMACQKRLPPEQFDFVPYETLRGKMLPVTIERIYNRLGLTPSPRYAARLQEEYTRALTFKSEHTYDLAEFGLTAPGVLASFEDIFDAFGFNKVV